MKLDCKLKVLGYNVMVCDLIDIEAKGESYYYRFGYVGDDKVCYIAKDCDDYLRRMFVDVIDDSTEGYEAALEAIALIIIKSNSSTVPIEDFIESLFHMMFNNKYAIDLYSIIRELKSICDKRNFSKDRIYY